MDVVEILAVAFVNGIGVTLGTYMANKGLIHALERFERKEREKNGQE